MAYTHLTLSGARSRLAESLGDPSLWFWSGPELNRLINEALSTWNSVAQYFKNRTLLQIAAGQTEYDLGTTANYVRGTTYEDVVRGMCDMLQEPVPVGGVWQGTDMFTLDEVLHAVEQAANEFLLKTGATVIVIGQSTGLPSPPDGRLTLADTNIIDVRRFVWTPHDTQIPRQLWRTDEWARTATQYQWMQASGIPEEYSIVGTEPLTLQLMPPPASGGVANMHAVRAVEPANLSTTLAISQDLIWVVKYGALANLLGGDGQVRDPQRAAYCRQRFEEGLEIAKYAYPTVQTAHINGAPVFVEPVQNIDALAPNWFVNDGVPSMVAMSGHNLLCVAPKPNGTYSLAVEGVTNSPVLVDDADYVEIGREFVDAILNYARHLAHFKMGGPELEGSVKWIDTFYKTALERNAHLRASSSFFEKLSTRPYVEIAFRPAAERVKDNAITT